MDVCSTMTAATSGVQTTCALYDRNSRRGGAHRLRLRRRELERPAHEHRRPKSTADEIRQPSERRHVDVHMAAWASAGGDEQSRDGYLLPLRCRWPADLQNCQRYDVQLLLSGRPASRDDRGTTTECTSPMTKSARRP